MRIYASLPLALSKERKRIEVKYNTFEKATYDQFLCASIALRAKSVKEAHDYIDDITGNGSLNLHFKHLYEESQKFTDAQLEAVMSNSMYPIVKIDKDTFYDYFSELDVSLCRGKIYEGDLASYDDDFIAQITGIREPIIEKTVLSEKGKVKRPQPYEVIIEDKSVIVVMGSKNISINPSLFADVVVNDLDSIRKYKGSIMLSPDGDEWKLLTNASLNDFVNGQRFYYDEDGVHVLVREKDVRKTVVAKAVGLYFFKQSVEQYKGNANLCEKVIDFLLSKGEIKNFKPHNVIAMLNEIDDIKGRDVVNYFLKRQDNRDYAKHGLSLLLSGIETGWEKSALKTFLKYFETVSELEAIYKIDNSLGFDIKDLIMIDKSILTEKDIKKVYKYNSDLEKKRELITRIIGEVTTSGLRDRKNILKADAEVQKFSRLCNKFIGHEKRNIAKANADELDAWLKEAIELKEMCPIIEQKLSKTEK